MITIPDTDDPLSSLCSAAAGKQRERLPLRSDVAPFLVSGGTESRSSEAGAAALSNAPARSFLWPMDRLLVYRSSSRTETTVAWLTLRALPSLLRSNAELRALSLAWIKLRASCLPGSW